MSMRYIPDILRPYKNPIPQPVKPVLGPDGLYDRVEQVEAEIIIYNHEREKATSGISYADAIKAAKTLVLDVNLSDDVGNRLVGQTVPGTARVDGSNLYAVAVFTLKPDHKVEKLFKIRDMTEADKAEAAKRAAEIEAVKPDVILKVLAVRRSGAVDAEAIAEAMKCGVSEVSAGLILQAIDVLLTGAKKDVDVDRVAEQAAPALAEAVKTMSQQPGAAEFLRQAQEHNSGVGSFPTPNAGVVTGNPGVNARITGEAVATLAPDGSVG